MTESNLKVYIKLMMIRHESPVRKLIFSRQALCPIVLCNPRLCTIIPLMHYHPMPLALCTALPEESSHLPPFESRRDPTSLDSKTTKQSTKIPKQRHSRNNQRNHQTEMENNTLTQSYSTDLRSRDPFWVYIVSQRPPGKEPCPS